MSFGFSTGEIVNLSQLALKIISNSRKAGREYDELAREVMGLHKVISRLKHEAETPGSLLSCADELVRDELEGTIRDCGRVLQDLDSILLKHHGLLETNGAVRMLWNKIRFGNGDMEELGELRSKIKLYTSVITLQLNLISLGSQGRVEMQLRSHGSDMRAMQKSLNRVAASFGRGHEGSVLTDYSGDNKVVWRQLRHDLVADGFQSSFISKHKSTIIDYVKELGERGVLDEPSSAHQVTSDSVQIDFAEEDEIEVHATCIAIQRRELGAFGSANSKMRHEPKSGSRRRQREINCIQCGDWQRSRDEPYFLTCGHAWCKKCFSALLLGYGLALVVQPPTSCCTKLIQPFVITGSSSANLRMFVSNMSAEHLTRYKINLGATYCPQFSCGKRIDKNFPKRTCLSSDREIMSCPECNHDMCITCNDAAHSSDKLCISPQEREMNVTQMGLLHALFKPFYHPELGARWKDVHDYYTDILSDDLRPKLESAGLFI